MISIKKDAARNMRGQFSYYVTFPYSMQIVNIMRSLVTKYYHYSEKVWEVYTGELDYLIDKLKSDGLGYTLVGEPEKALPPAPAAVSEVIDISSLQGVKFKTEPYEYQKEGIAYGLTHSKFLLADEQGLGKTLQVLNIATIKRMKEKFKHCLIIVGYNTLKDNWMAEVAKHTNEKGYILGTRYKKKDGSKFIGTGQDKLADLDRKDIDEFFLITNIDTIRMVEKIKYRTKNGKYKTKNSYIMADKINALCRNGTIGMVVID